MSGGGVVYGGSVLAATVAGAVALFAPCCISVMLPAYFASSFHNRRLLVAMTFLFGAGVATVVLPIALGAAVLQRLLVGQHTLIWLAGGALLLGLGGYTLAGGQLRLPMPGRSAQTKGGPGPLAVWSLGVFSGVASACCAPVLAGVVALSGLAASFGRALGLGAAYVFGMVAPLFVLALWWERRDWQASRLFRPRSFTFRVGRPRPPAAGRPERRAATRRPTARRRRGGLSVGVKLAGVVGLAIIVLLAIFLVANRGGGQQRAGRYAYQVGDPGPGATAPPIKLATTDGATFELGAPAGQTTLLYFQEGLGCQPCWDQLTDIQANLDSYQALGITRVLSITTDPLDAIRQKVTDQRITIPVASDPDLAVSRAYHANQYGMMGQSRDGHSFIVVGPDGVIRWRADYGGAPDYTMYVPSPSLLADLRAGLAGQAR